MNLLNKQNSRVLGTVLISSFSKAPIKSAGTYKYTFLLISEIDRRILNADQTLQLIHHKL